MKMSLLLAAALLLAAPTFAQTPPEVKLPPSPPGHAAAQVGGSWSTVEGQQRYTGGQWITVDYSRPLLRGRTNIFGSGADYGKTVSGGDPVWRAGANATTRLTMQAPLTIGGKTLAPGVYSLLVELKEGAWTLVVSSQPALADFDPNEKVKLYGSTNYDPKFDVLRAPMKVSTSPVSVEQFTIAFVDMTTKGGRLAMSWDTTSAVVDFTSATP